MPTVVDALIVTLGLDASKFTAGQKAVVEDLRKTEAQASRTGKNLEHSGAQAAQFFGQVRNQALSLFAVFMGGRGIKEFATYTMNTAAATGRLAQNLGMSARELSAWQGAAEQFAGGSAAGVAGSITNLSQDLQGFIHTGQSRFLPYLRAQHIAIGDANQRLLPMAEILMRISRTMQGMSGPEALFFGHNLGFDDGMINLLRQGPGAVRAELAKVRQQGVVDAKQAKDFQDLQTATRGATQGLEAFARMVLDDLSPMLIAALNAIAKTDPLKKGWKDLSNPNNYRIEHNPNAPTPPAIAAIGGWWGRNMPTWLGGNTPMSGDRGARTRQAMSYFMSQGWSREQSAGIVANLIRESGFDTGLVGDGGAAYGIAQWHPDRQAAFKAWSGHDIRQSTLQEQLAFVQYELTQGGEQAAGARLRATKSASDAGAVVSTYYERPANSIAEAQGRGALAGRLMTLPPPGGRSVNDILNGIRASRPDLVSNVNTEVHISHLEVHSQATDATGIARDIRGAIAEHPLVTQANRGLR